MPPTFCCRWLFGQLMSWRFGQKILETTAVSAREKENQTTSSVRHRRLFEGFASKGGWNHVGIIWDTLIAG